MPTAPCRPCPYPGCPNLIGGISGTSYCPDHRPTATRSRGQTYERIKLYRTSRWRKLSKLYLRRHPLCANHQIKYNLDRIATIVDHVKPHRGDPNLFWDQSNWQSLCKRCHDIKTGHGQ